MIKRKPMGRKGIRKATRGKISPVVKSKHKKRGIAPKKKKQTKIGLWREWNVPDWAYHRYEGMRGVYWFWFSRTIRERDYERWSGKCMTCGKYVEKGSDQAGHLFAARNCGFRLLFEPMNVHLQHSKCNNPRFTPSAGVFNALNIEKRYGEGTIARLAQKKEERTKEWTKEQYTKEIQKLPAYQASLQ